MKTQSVISVPPSAGGVQRKEMSEHMYLTREIQRLTLCTALDAVTARALIRRLANSVGYNVLDQVRISTAIVEIARDIMAYAGRAVTDDQSPALVFPNGFRTEQYLFNAHRVGEGELYLTRDPLAVLTAFDAGIDNVAA